MYNFFIALNILMVYKNGLLSSVMINMEALSSKSLVMMAQK